jgi:hypothetical protein
MQHFFLEHKAVGRTVSQFFAASALTPRTRQLTRPKYVWSRMIVAYVCALPNCGEDTRARQNYPTGWLQSGAGWPDRANFLLGSIFLITEVAQVFGLLFPRKKKFCIKLDSYGHPDRRQHLDTGRRDLAFHEWDCDKQKSGHAKSHGRLFENGCLSTFGAHSHPSSKPPNYACAWKSYYLN